MSSTTRNRRQTLKQLGAVAGLAAVGPLMAGCGTTRRDADVIVIGAGLAGLNAALMLQDQGLDVLVLEADTRIGGRICTLDNVPGRPEAGGSEIGAGYARVRDMMTRLGGFELERWMDHVELQFALRIDGTTMATADWAESPVNRLTGAEKNTGPFGPFALPMIYAPKPSPLPELDSWLKPEVAQYDIPYDQYLRTLGASDEALRLLAGQVPSESVSGVSALWQLRMLRYQNAVGTLKELDQIKAGTSRLPEGMAGQLKRELLLKSPVAAIESGADAVTLETTVGARFRASFVVCAVPGSMLRTIRFEPGLPDLQAEAAMQLPQGHNTSVYFSVTAPFWEDDGLPGSLWTNEDIGRVFLFRGSAGDYLWMNKDGSRNAAVRDLDNDSVMALALSELHTARPSTVGKVKPAAVMNWSRHRWLRGHLPYRGPGQITRYGNILAQPAGRVHFAGDHTAVMNYGMEGAMESGERAALEILDRI